MSTFNRKKRIHWNAATDYENLEAHLLDLMEALTPLPTDTCRLVLKFLAPASCRLDMCLPLPKGAIILQRDLSNQPTIVLRSDDDDSGELHDCTSTDTRSQSDRSATAVTATVTRPGCTSCSYHLRFSGGGSLALTGSLFCSKQRIRDRQVQARANTARMAPNHYGISDPRERSYMIPYWFATPRLWSTESLADLEASMFHEAPEPPGCELARPAAKRRKLRDSDSDSEEDATTPRARSLHDHVHRRAFAYYQVMPFGVHLYSHPEAGSSVGLVHGTSLVFGNLFQIRGMNDEDLGRSYDIACALRLPLQRDQVQAFFRPIGRCEFHSQRCTRPVNSDCINSCCDDHCASHQISSPSRRGAPQRRPCPCHDETVDV